MSVHGCEVIATHPNHNRCQSARGQRVTSSVGRMSVMWMGIDVVSVICGVGVCVPAVDPLQGASQQAEGKQMISNIKLVLINKRHLHARHGATWWCETCGDGGMYHGVCVCDGVVLEHTTIIQYTPPRHLITPLPTRHTHCTHTQNGLACMYSVECK